MHDDERTPRQSPYRQAAPPREAKPAREISFGVVACFVLLIVLLAGTLSAEPSQGQSFGGLGGWHPAGPAHGAQHHR
jgi:hypothetical protein